MAELRKLDISEGVADPSGKIPRLDVLKYKQGEEGPEVVPTTEPDPNKLYGAGKGEVLTGSERKELEEYAADAQKARKEWEKNRDATLLGEFLKAKKLNGGVVRALVLAILVGGLSIRPESETSGAQTSASQDVHKGGFRGGDLYSKWFKIDDGVGEKSGVKKVEETGGVMSTTTRSETIKEGKDATVVRENEASKMVASDPEFVGMAWAPKYDVKEMSQEEKDDLTGKIDKIIDDYLSKNNISLEDLQKLKEQGVENKISVAGLASPEGSAEKNQETKQGRSDLARKLIEQRLREKGLGEFFSVLDKTEKGDGAFADGKLEKRGDVYEKLKKTFSVESDKDLLDIIKKFNRGELSKDGMTEEQAELMKKVFTENRGVSVTFTGGAIERTAEVDVQKGEDETIVTETETKVPFSKEVTSEKKNKTGRRERRRLVVPPQPRPEPNKSSQLQEPEKGIFETFTGIQDPQEEEQLPLGKKRGKKVEKIVPPPRKFPSHISEPALIPDLKPGFRPPNRVDLSGVGREYIKDGSTLAGRKGIFGPKLGRTAPHRGDRGIMNWSKGKKELGGGRKPRR